MALNQNRKEHEGWEPYDTAFRLAAEQNVKILPILLGKSEATYPSANETRFPTEAEYGPPSSPWEDWIYEVVHRYGINGDFWTANPLLPYKPVTMWEVWNEPNLPEYNPLYWDGTKWVEKAQPENYAKFLRRTNQALQAAQNERGAGAEVLFAGLYSPGGMSVTEFLNKAHNVSEIFNSFTALSLHPYAFNGTTVEGNVSTARTALKNLGWNSKPIWVTEVGWPIEGEHAVYPIQQAEYLHNSFTWLVQNSATLNVPYVAWYDYRDINGAPWDFHSGLKDVNGNKRPSWCTYEDMIQVSFCNPFPPAWESDNLGGYIFGDQTVSAPEKGKLNIFAWGAGSQLWHKWYDPAIGGWSGWYQMISSKGHGNVASGPDSASWAPNRVDVVARVEDNSVEHWYWDGSAWHADNLGGGTKFDPTISAPESGKLNVFAVGGDGQLWHKWYDPAIGGWSGWYQMALATHGALTSGPDSVSWAPNRVDVVARAGDGTIEHWYWDGSAWHVDNLGGSNTVGAPAITSWESGRLDVFENIENSPHRKSWIPGVGWTAWEPMYGLISSGIDAASWGKGRIDIVAQAFLGNNSVMHAYTGS